MVALASTLSRLRPIKALVIGDLLLDVYTIGKARRISPEAPVAVVHVISEEQRPGGAGNVMVNLISLGAQVSALGRVGFDGGGQDLKKALQDENIDISYIIAQDGYKTPVKNRIISDNQQVVRVDHEQLTALPELLEQQFIETLPKCMEGVNIVAISDYGKGFVTTTLLRAIISQAKKQGALVIVDPKGQDFARYKGADVIKPNLSEAYAAAALPPSAPIDMAAKRVLEMTSAKLLMITRSESGISLFESCGKRSDFPVHAREIKDVTGAGDTVLAMLTYSLANGLSYAEAAQLCNIAAGLAIEHLGCARITLADMAHRLLEMNPNNKVFDEAHLYALQKVLATQPFQIVTLSTKQGPTLELFQELKNIASNKQGKLLVYIADENPSEPFVEMLASFKEVDFILLHEESLNLLLEHVQPAATHILEKVRS